MSLAEGGLAVVVKDGSVMANINRLLEDSVVEIDTGSVSINVPNGFAFRLDQCHAQMQFNSILYFISHRAIQYVLFFKLSMSSINCTCNLVVFS